MDSMAPLVSIVVPSFNTAKFLPTLCQSIQAQTFGNFEVLIGDDGSTDETSRAVGPFLADKRFQYFRWEANRGVNHATVMLLSRARGQFWAYPGADDALQADFLERRLALMQACPHVGMIHGPPLLIDEVGRPISSGVEHFPIVRTGLSDKRVSGAEIVRANSALEILLQHNIVNTPSVMVRMEATRSIHVHLLTDWRYAQDWSFWILHAASGWDLAFDDRPVNQYRILSSSLSNDPLKAALRRAEIRLVPLCALSQAAAYSHAAAQLWLRWRRNLYALWLRRACMLARTGSLKDNWLQLGAAAFYGRTCNRVSLAVEIARHACSIVVSSAKESATRRQQAFAVSGLAQLDHPVFRRT